MIEIMTPIALKHCPTPRDHHPVHKALLSEGSSYLEMRSLRNIKHCARPALAEWLSYLERKRGEQHLIPF